MIRERKTKTERMEKPQNSGFLYSNNFNHNIRLQDTREEGEEGQAFEDCKKITQNQLW